MTDIRNQVNAVNQIVDRWEDEDSNPFKEFQDNNPFVAEIPETQPVDIEALQNMLGVLGTVFEPADAVNALIYGSKGDYENAALYGAGVGIYGGIFKKIKEFFKPDMVAKAQKTLKDLGFRNIDDFDDWHLLKLETDQSYRKFFGEKAYKYVKWLKNWKEKRKAESLLPKNISFEDIMKTDDPVKVYKEAVRQGNLQFKNIHKYDYDKIVKKIDLKKLFEDVHKGTK